MNEEEITHVDEKELFRELTDLSSWTDEQIDAFVCYNHEATFRFKKDGFLKLLGLNPEAFYEIIEVEDDYDGMINLKLSVKNSNDFFFTKEEQK